MEQEQSRTFPETTRDTLIAFIYHTNRIERIPMTKDAIEQAMARREPNPYVEGHLRAISLIQELATKPDLIPESVPSVFYVHDKIPWLKRLHRNICRPIAEYGKMMVDPSYIQPHEVGEMRQSEKIIISERNGTVESIPMPDPLNIMEHLLSWAQDLSNFHNEHKRLIDYGRYNDDDLSLLIDKAYEANLRISCIKPFVDGSNRVGRLVENLLRLNWGLPWKVIVLDDKEKYIDDLRNMQKEYL